MLNQNDLAKIGDVLGKLNVLRMEVKEFPAKKYKLPVRELLLETADGKEYVGDLNSEKFVLKELTGLTSVLSCFVRNNSYGDNGYRGNHSGRISEKLFLHFNPKKVIDPMEGGRTNRHVCQKLGIPYAGYDLRDGFDATKDELDESSDAIFWHPPYMVFPGSNMPQYSGKQWGNEIIPTDGSHITDPKDFTKWLNTVYARLYTSLRKNGRMFILVGDSRFKGQYYSMFRQMDVYGKIENIFVKQQHNCFSDETVYTKNSFVPIIHEMLFVVRKDHEYIVPCLVVKEVAVDLMKSVKIEWKDLIKATIEHLGGKATRKQLGEILKDHPKAKNNNFVDEKIRQVINLYNRIFVKDENGYVSLA